MKPDADDVRCRQGLTEKDRLLLEFLGSNDAPCPACGYNVRGLTRPVCPECQRELHLSVGVVDVSLRWFIAAIAPGLFSGIAALLLLIPIVLVPLTGGGLPPGFVVATDGFGFASGIGTLVLIFMRHRFLACEMRKQYVLAAVIWAVHLAVFFWLMGVILGWY